jgi:hypothetical protein
MRRILMLVTVALVMTAMMAVFSTGAVAQPSCAAAPPATGQPGEEFGRRVVSPTAQAGGREFAEQVVETNECVRQND